MEVKNFRRVRGGGLKGMGHGMAIIYINREWGGG